MSFDLGGTSETSFPFLTFGDSVTGKVVDVKEIQQTDMNTGLPACWPDGKPKMQHRVTLQTELRNDPDDDGMRSVFLRGGRKPEDRSTLSAVLGAIKAATGGTALDAGGLLTLTYVADRPGAQRGFVAKCYEATYRPPSTQLGEQPAQQYVPPQQQYAQPARQPVPSNSQPPF